MEHQGNNNRSEPSGFGWIIPSQRDDTDRVQENLNLSFSNLNLSDNVPSGSVTIRNNTPGPCRPGGTGQLDNRVGFASSSAASDIYYSEINFTRNLIRYFNYTYPTGVNGIGDSLQITERYGFRAMAMDIQLYRALDRSLDVGNSIFISEVFYELVFYAKELALNYFGSSVLQKLIERCEDWQRLLMLTIFARSEDDFLSVCLSSHGTRAIQKLLQHISTADEATIVVHILMKVIVNLCKEVHGHSVIRICLERLSREANKDYLKIVAAHAIEIATHQHGCCIMQRFIEYSQGETRTRLLNPIIQNALQLSIDPHGNYVIQLVMELQILPVTGYIVAQLQGYYLQLSCNKCASNVVERCLKHSTKDQSRRIIEELLVDQNVSTMLIDPYGNFVFQVALSVAEGRTMEELQGLVRRNIGVMKNNKFGKKVISYIRRERLMPGLM